MQACLLFTAQRKNNSNQLKNHHSPPSLPEWLLSFGIGSPNGNPQKKLKLKRGRQRHLLSGECKTKYLLYSVSIYQLGPVVLVPGERIPATSRGCKMRALAAILKPLQMQKAILIISLLFFFIFKINSQNVGQTDSLAEVSEKKLLNEPFHPFRLTNRRIQLSNDELLGKVVYINFWFTACAPCMQEMPQINELFEKFKNDTNFALISITYDDPEKIEAIKEKFQIRYNIFSVTHPECLRLNPTHSYPANIILNKKGIIEFYETGSEGINFLISRHFKRKIHTKIAGLLNGR